tara:strand:+ start:23 stop:442 length:420 start_codon:yes stop_codon:yes gene_type:complete
MSLSIYQKLADGELIKGWVFTKKPRRARQKSMGWMWEAEIKVEDKDGKIYIFDVWHHFFSDDGSQEWKPSNEVILRIMHCQYVFIGDKKCSKNGYTICVDNTYYTSKRGFFNHRNNREEVIEQIRNGTWKENPDIELLV